MCRGCRKRGGRRGILKVPTLGDTGADIGARESRKGRKKSGRRKVPKSGRNRNKITQNCVIFCIQKGAKEQEPGLKVGGEREEWTPCPPPRSALDQCTSMHHYKLTSYTAAGLNPSSRTLIGSLLPWSKDGSHIKNKYSNSRLYDLPLGIKMQVQNNVNWTPNAITG